MIVISTALVISPLAEEPLTHPVIGWQSVATPENATVTSEDPDHPAINMANPSTNLFWRGLVDSPAVDEYLTVFPGEAVIDYIAIARHNLGTAGCVLSVEILIDAVWTELIEETLLADDAPVIGRFLPQSVEGIRLRIQPGSEAPEIAVFHVGKLLVFERGVQGDYTPLPFGRVANVISGRSERGDYLGRIVSGSHTESAATFAHLSPTWVRTYLEPFLEVSAERPFFFAWSPDAYPDEVGYAWLENDPQPAFNIDGYTTIEFRMTGIVQ